MSKITVSVTAYLHTIIQEIRNERNVCCKIFLERGIEHNSYTATKGILQKLISQGRCFSEKQGRSYVTTTVEFLRIIDKQTVVNYHT